MCKTVPGFINLVPFKTTTVDTIIGASGFAVLDQAGTLLDSILGGTAYSLKHPGDYRAVLLAKNTTTQIEIHTQVEANASAVLASPISGTIDKVGDVKRYSIALTAGTPTLLTLQIAAGGFAQWVAPNGEVVSGLGNGATVVPVFSAGTYQLELYGSANSTDFRFQLNDLSQAIAIAPGAHSGQYRIWFD